MCLYLQPLSLCTSVLCPLTACQVHQTDLTHLVERERGEGEGERERRREGGREGRRDGGRNGQKELTTVSVHCNNIHCRYLLRC